MYVISVMNQKGGTGKTTTAMQLCAGLHMRGNRVIAIDLDAQANMSAAMLSGDDGEGRRLSPRLSVYDLLLRRASARDVIVATASCDLIPASLEDRNLSFIDEALADDPIGKVFRLAETLQPISDDYDYCIIDTPPARSLITYNALVASDGIVAPVCASEFSISGVVDLGDSLAKVRRYSNRDPKILGIVITQYRANTIVARSLDTVIADVAQKLDTRLFDAHIREATAIVESQSVGTDIFDYAPKSAVANDYNRFIDELLEVTTNA